MKSMSLLEIDSVAEQQIVYNPETMIVRRLHDLQREITCVELFNQYILIGTAQSQVAVYDMNLHFLKQFPSLNIGPLISLAISEMNIEQDSRISSEIKSLNERLDAKQQDLEVPEVICQSPQMILVAHRTFTFSKNTHFDVNHDVGTVQCSENCSNNAHRSSHRSMFTSQLTSSIYWNFHWISLWLAWNK